MEKRIEFLFEIEIKKEVIMTSFLKTRTALLMYGILLYYYCEMKSFYDQKKNIETMNFEFYGLSLF